MKPAVLAPPGQCAVRFEVHVLRPRGGIRHLVDGVGLLKPSSTLPSSP
jgi:hypothetical protein